MLLDIDFERPGTFCPGDTFTCPIDVQSTFKIRCKYIKVRLRCPYQRSNAEEFRIYAIANQRISKDDFDLDYQVGEKAENIVLLKGLNKFVVSCKIPDVSSEVFQKYTNQYSNVIRCSFKVTINPNWLPKRCCLDWFLLAPRTTVDEVFDKIETGGQALLDRIRGFISRKQRKT